MMKYVIGGEGGEKAGGLGISQLAAVGRDSPGVTPESYPTYVRT